MVRGGALAEAVVVAVGAHAVLALLALARRVVLLRPARASGWATEGDFQGRTARRGGQEAPASARRQCSAVQVAAREPQTGEAGSVNGQASVPPSRGLPFCKREGCSCVCDSLRERAYAHGAQVLQLRDAAREALLLQDAAHKGLVLVLRAVVAAEDAQLLVHLQDKACAADDTRDTRDKAPPQPRQGSCVRARFLRGECMGGSGLVSRRQS